MTIALVDGDIVCYRTAAVCENEDAPLALWQADELMKRILADVNASDHKVYISGDRNFRYEIYPDYKANRKDKPKPRHLDAVREHLFTKWDAEITDGIEADDALGIRSRDRSTDTIICSIDKDLLQLDGLHYNFVRREIVQIDEESGWRNFYLQLLIGDPGDNIPGCPKIGKVKAPRVLGGSRTPSEMFLAVEAAYRKAGESLVSLIRNAHLLFILREEGIFWNPPVKVSPQKAEPLSTSSASSPVSCSEPTKAQPDTGIPADGH